MLRHLRRDRFAPHLPLEREHREAAFAHAEDRKVSGVEGVDRQGILGASATSPQENIQSVTDTMHGAAAEVLQTEDLDRLVNSSAFTDALQDIGHPPETIVRALEHTSDNRTDALREILNDPASLIAAIRAMEYQQKQYAQLIDSVESTSTSGIRIGANSSVRETLSRSDAAESIRVLMEHNDQRQLEQWIAQAKPRELQRLLGIEDRPSALRRLITLVQDQWHRATLRSGAWANTEKKLSAKELQKRQENYFAQVDRHLVSLKKLLKQKLENKANQLEEQMTREVRQGLSTLIGRDISTLESVSPDAWDALDQRIEKDLGVTLEDIFEQINAAADRVRALRNLSVSSDNFTAEVESLLATDAGITWQQAVTEAQDGHKIVDTDIVGFLEAYDEIKPQLGKDRNARTMLASIMGVENPDEASETLQEFANVLRDPNAKDRMSIKSRLIYSKALQLTPAIRAMLRQGHHNVLPTQGATPSAEQFSGQSEKVLSKVNEVEQLLKTSPVQESFTCKTVGITGKLEEQISAARVNLRRAEMDFSNEKNNAEQKKRATMQLAAVGFQIDQMRNALRFIETGIAKQAKVTTKPCRGCSNFGTGEYFVNPEWHHVPPPDGPISATALARTADHERGHLIMDTLTEKTHVLTNLFEQQQEDFAEFAENGLEANENLESILEKAAQSWDMDRAGIGRDGDTIHAIGGADRYYRRKRWEELLMKYGTYRNKAEAIGEGYNLDTDTEEFPSAEERRLLHLLDAQYNNASLPTVAKEFPEERFGADGRTILAFHNGGAHDEDDMYGEGDSESPDAKAEKIKGPTIEDFKQLRSQIQYLGQFIQTYPESGSGWIGEVYRDAKAGYDLYFRQFDEHVSADGSTLPDGYRPEDDEDFGNIIRNAKKVLKTVRGDLDKFDAKSLQSVAEAKAGGKEFWLWMTRDIQWLSIMDYWTIAKEGWEDVSRLWKRRGENARGKVGELLTGWIGDKVPYLGQLKHEFHRRQQDSELSAVQVWEKALDNVDSYKLIDEIEHVNSPDHLKAIIALLTKRGRLVWEDKKLLIALSRFSHFKIPIDECHRDPILLEKWLQKVIADIWADKDLYRSWKTSNEHNYDSERDKFEGVAGYMSVGGKLQSELEYMLKTFIDAKENDKPIPDQVNPHYYEKLFFYSMQNGKMSMQAKFFYLVQGIRYGLIPHDRLALINGKVSTESFPFIDYFYQQNNTLPELIELGKTIEEKGEKRFEPGPKCIAFLIEEVGRDERARQRLVKVISRQGQKIDHEDIPMATALLNYGAWNEFLIVASGAIQRMSPEGMKNAYVGYNTLFKTYGMISKKKADSNQLLSRQDAKYLASRLAAFAHFDNIVVRQANNGKARPDLTIEEIKTGTMPSAEGKTPAHFRDKMHKLMDKVMEEYKGEIEAFLMRKGKLEVKQKDGPNKAITVDTYLDTYLGRSSDHKTRDEKILQGDEKLRIFDMSADMQEALTEAIGSDGGMRLMDVLQDMSIADPRNPSKELLDNEGDDPLKFDKEIFGRQSRFAKANGGNGHGAVH